MRARTLDRGVTLNALLTMILTYASRLKRIHLSLTHGPSLQSLHGMGFKRIQADSGRLAQILINLLSNAIRKSCPS